MLLFFWLYSAVMIPFSVIPYEAKVSTLRLGCYVGVYWAVANLCSRFPRRKVVLSVLVMGLLAVALYSLVQHKIAPGELFGSERYTKYWEWGRLGGTYQCPNHIAHLFQMWIPFCLVFLFMPQFGWFWRICFGYALPVFGLLIYQTQSRAGLLGAVAAVGALFLVLMFRKSRKAFAIALIAAPLLAAAGVGGLWAGSSMFRERMQPVMQFVQHVFSGAIIEEEFEDFRPQTWLDSMAMVKERPWLGVGAGNYGQTFPEYRQRVFATRMETVHPHSEPIELITEYGVVGALIFAGALIAFCVPVLRMIRTSERLYHVLPAAALLAALAGTAVHGLFDFELRIFPNALMLSVLAGCAVAPLLAQQRSEVRSLRSEAGGQGEDARKQNLAAGDRTRSSDSRSPTSVPLRLTSVLRPLTSVLLLLAAVWSIQVFGSAGLRVHGDRLRLEGDRQRAEQVYKASLAMDPQNWWAHLGAGQVYSYYRYRELVPMEKAAWSEKELDAFAAAYKHNSKKEEVVYGLGRAELAAGNREEGLDYLRQAANYKRFNDFYWRKLGIELRKAVLYDEALDVFEYAQKIDRTNKTVQRNIEWIHKQMEGQQ